MIITKNITPEIYYDRSRDFQLLGRVYDIIFNYMRTNALKVKDSTLSKKTSDELIDLICYTLGFKFSPRYNIEQLRAVCSIFMLAIRNKGNIVAIQLAIYSILHSANISTLPSVTYDYDTYTLSIRVPAELKDLSLLTDVLEYILPAGVKCVIFRKSSLDAETLVDVYSDISTDDISKKTLATSSYMSVIPIPGETHIADITQADLGPHRNDSMAIPTDAAANIIEDDENEGE